MMHKKKLGIIGLVVIAIVAGFFIYRDMRKSDALPEGQIIGNNMNGGKVEAIPLPGAKLPPTPALVRATDFDKTLAPEVKTILLARLEKAVTAVKNDSKNAENWIELGLERKALADYEGARDAWEYAKALEPNNLVPWNNLGDLYHYYLKDYAKSEENWKKTIALKPDYALGYRGLYELYLYSLTAKSSEIPALLRAGIAANPKALDLQALLVDYQKLVTK